MFEWLDKSEGHVLGMKIGGRVTKEDYDQFIPAMEEAIEEYGKISVLVEIEHITGVDPGAMWEEIKFDVHHLKHIERFAVVGDARWEERSVRIMDPFIKAQCKFFRKEDEDEAWRWLREGLEPRDAQR